MKRRKIRKEWVLRTRGKKRRSSRRREKDYKEEECQE